jgi:ribulose-5-phosphate 4-epimerase/fuculose-1-phosphate aldolase
MSGRGGGDGGVGRGHSRNASASRAAAALRVQLAWGARILAQHGHGDLTLGHISGRFPGASTAFIKRKGLGLEEVTPDDFAQVTLDGEQVGGRGPLHLENVIHLEIYRARPDVNCVIHTHPPYATAFGATGAAFRYVCHDSVLFADGLPVFDETADLIVNAGQARAIAKALGGCKAVLLKNHGATVVGVDVPWAVLAALTLERALRLQAMAGSFGELRPLPQAEAAAMYHSKYRDAFLPEYWDSWVRALRRAGLDGGMPAPRRR